MINGEEGLSTVIVVVIIGVLILLFSASLSVTTILGTTASFDQINSDSTYYLAESGLEDTLRILQLNTAYDPGTVVSPIGEYEIEGSVLGDGSYELIAKTEKKSTVRRSAVTYVPVSSGPPEVAPYAMFAGEELAFVHNSNSSGRKGSVKGDLYAKDSIRVVRFIVGWSDGSQQTTMISTGNYGQGGGIGQSKDQLYKNSETYYTNFYTLNDVSTHNSATASHLTVYYRDHNIQSISLPSGSNNTKIEDPTILESELTNPQFDFDSACTLQTGESESIYTYTDSDSFKTHIIATNGALEDGVHCIETGDVTVNTGKNVTLNGSIVVKDGFLIILDELSLNDIYNLPVVASKGRLVLGNDGTYMRANLPAPHSAEITGTIYASDDVTIGNYGSDGSTTTPSFKMEGAIWAKKNLYVIQSNSIKNLNLDIVFDQNYTMDIREFNGENTDGYELRTWGEDYGY
ncbi:hypothetical protein KC660_03925 [Candidatus Dojkabacteria bacterium]|uniref:Uncharacterized protein n=1 Tax=Candidatus Dojkabacteria bacterium TaxID=2099670 RepID=A0A955RIC1_9BACT|nr:hypothetical protein [Candidatus Dojkabacteria bacterium]